MIFSEEHYTTKNMLSCLSQCDLKDKVVFDIGTGSGVLADYCLNHGCKSVYCTDVDEESVSYTKKRLNNSKAHVYEGDLFSKIPKNRKADIILANLYPDEAYRVLREFKNYLKKDGLLFITIITGFVIENLSLFGEVVYGTNGYEYNCYVLKHKNKEEL